MSTRTIKRRINVSVRERNLPFDDFLLADGDKMNGCCTDVVEISVREVEDGSPGKSEWATKRTSRLPSNREDRTSIFY